MSHLAVVVENDEQRDRKTCIALDQKVAGANRELAQWLLDHPQYSGAMVGVWLGCTKSRINQLRRWARGGFAGTPFDLTNHPDKRRNDLGRGRSELKSKDNLDDGAIPSEEEAEESYQDTLFEQACLLLSEMADETRQRFFAKLKEVYGYAT